MASWYDTVYLPLAQVIRDQQLLKHFSGRTEADLYLWMVAQSERPEAGDRESAGSPRSPRVRRKPWTVAVVRAVREAMRRLRRAL